jgi:hypothetical protein
MGRVRQREYAGHAEAETGIAGFFGSGRLHSVPGKPQPSVCERNMAGKTIFVSEPT